MSSDDKIVHLADHREQPIGSTTEEFQRVVERGLAKAVGLSLRTIQRVWEVHRLQPHRIRTFKHSNDPASAAKIRRILETGTTSLDGQALQSGS
ncbi:hypothetical protein SAE02_54510 [Skermanella aerolata]|uniref:Uncharacterized protein n=1 Tax=Skermanella aerolata TaxID=393310 RepID=A0A512DXU6_9PROT|nr:hypothetical protein N826_13245 [Skermanella aerolata KACC 11604]GEO41303.1 hypothetical protein SAE02_54510 [Skermanella aerolata]